MNQSTWNISKPQLMDTVSWSCMGGKGSSLSSITHMFKYDRITEGGAAREHGRPGMRTEQFVYQTIAK